MSLSYEHLTTFCIKPDLQAAKLYSRHFFNFMTFLLQQALL